MSKVTADIAVLQNEAKDIRDDIKDIKVDVKDIKEHYLTKEEFNANFAPVKSVVYGLVSVILLAVAGVAGTAINFFLRMKP